MKVNQFFRLCYSILAFTSTFVYASPIYTQNTNLTPFIASVQTYATFTNFWYADKGSAAYTPTNADVTSGFRVGGRAIDAIVVDFGAAVSQILVFPNIDHIGYGFDAYQYVISGSNDGISYAPLFAPLLVNEADDPGLTTTHFTLKTWNGTAPTLVNNELTAGTGPGGVVGYEAYFDFGSAAYRYYKFGVSTVPGGYDELELTAVAQAQAIPEPATLLIVSLALALLPLSRRCTT